MRNDYTPGGSPGALIEIRAEKKERERRCPYSDLLRCVMLVGGSVMRGDESVVRGGGARTWSPKRHFFFLISFPETNLMGATSETQLVQVWCRFLKRSVTLRLFYFPLLLFDANNEFNIVLQNVLVKSRLRNISKVVIVIKEKWAVLSLQDFCFLQKISTQIKKTQSHLQTCYCDLITTTTSVLLWRDKIGKFPLAPFSMFHFAPSLFRVTFHLAHFNQRVRHYKPWRTKKTPLFMECCSSIQSCAAAVYSAHHMWWLTCPCGSSERWGDCDSGLALACQRAGGQTGMKNQSRVYTADSHQTESL